MLGEAISRLPVRLSVTWLTIGSRHGDHALRDAPIATLALGSADAGAQGHRPPDGLAAARPLACAAAHARLPWRDRPGDEDRRPPPAELAGDLAGPGRGAARPAALPH